MYHWQKTRNLHKARNRTRNLQKNLQYELEIDKNLENFESIFEVFLSISSLFSSFFVISSFLSMVDELTISSTSWILDLIKRITPWAKMGMKNWTRKCFSTLCMPFERCDTISWKRKHLSIILMICLVSPGEDKKSNLFCLDRRPIEARLIGITLHRTMCASNDHAIYLNVLLAKYRREAFNPF